jgi:hypothetical protein
VKISWLVLLVFRLRARAIRVSRISRAIPAVIKYRSGRLVELARIQLEMWQLVQAQPFKGATIT